MYSLKGKVIIKLVMELKTGLHIGGNAENFEIGGMDNPIIRDPITNRPYIPGSSLKGKMRFLYEWKTQKVSPDGEVHVCKTTEEAENCIICSIFGKSGSEEIKIGPTRLIVRDAFLTEESEKNLSEIETSADFVEWKKENVINRLTGTAKSPRDIERIPKGAEFHVNLVYTMFNGFNIKEKENLEHVIHCLALLEDDALGGYGSRGSGQIKFKNISIIYRSAAYYQGQEEQKEMVTDFPNLSELSEKIKEIIAENIPN